MFGGSNNPVVDIGISMTLQDRFSGPAGNALSSWRNMLQDMSTFSNGIQQTYGDLVNKNVSLLKGMYGAFEYSAAVQKNTFLTSKMMKTAEDQAFDFLGLAQEINERNPLTAMDITSGEKFMAMAGMTANQIANAAEPAAQLAAIFDMDMGGKGGTADLLTNIMATFQLSADKASEVGDILSVGTTSANMSMQDLAQSIKYVGANAKMAGMNISDITAAIGVLGNYGIQGSMAGTNLGQALNTMNKAITGTSQKGAKALAALGLTPQDLQTAEGNLIPVHDILVKIAETTKGMGNVQKQGILFNLFGQRGIRSIVPLLDDITSGANKYEEIMNNLQNSSGWLDSTTKEYMESPEGRIRALTSAWENFRVSAGAALSRVFVPILSTLTKIIHVVNTVANTGFGTWVIRGAAIVTGFRLMRNLLGMMVYTAKGFTTNLLTAGSRTNIMAGGLSKANIQAAQLEAHLRNITILLASQSLSPGQNIRLWGGTAYKDKNGVMGFRPGKGAGLGKSFFGGPVMMGWGMGTSGAVRTGAARFGTPIYRGTSAYMGRMFGQQVGRQVGLSVARGAAGIVGVGSKVLGILGGPWGLGISAALTFLPMIWDWLSNSKDSQDEDLDARQAARDAEIVKAIKEGRGATVSVNLNGSPMGTFSPGDSADIDLFGGDDLYGMGL